MTKAAVAVSALACCAATAAAAQTYAAVRVNNECSSLAACAVSIDVGDAPLAAAPSGAYGTYTRNTLNTTGWATLEVHTNASYPDTVSAYAAGYLEGYLSAVEIQQWAVNAHGGKTPYSPTLAAYVANNTAYVRAQVAANSDDPFWYHTGLTMTQFDGLYQGYSDAIASSAFSKDVIYGLTLVGDLDDLCPAFGCTSRLGQHTCSSKEECEGVPTGPVLLDARGRFDRTHGNGHCSILVKPLGYTAGPTDIVFGHTTWSPYTIMGPRIMKNYDFGFQRSATDSTPVPGRTIVFTSYPAVLYSFDDWYTISSGLTVSETTIINNNPSLWSAVQPNTVLIWSRAMVANRLASSGQEWVNTVAIQNSGTYNNAWHVVDWKTWSPGKPIPDGFLWQTEQMPGAMAPIDLSPILRGQTYWTSYNRVFDPALFVSSGQWDLVNQYGAHFTWDQTARAQIFRRNQSMVTDLDSYARLLRYNNFQADPLSAQGCSGGVHTASDAIAERGDLTPASGCTDPGTGQQNEGAIDCKYTSYTLLAAGKQPYLRMMAQVGPTYDQQPVFTWSGSPFAAYTHLGQPDSWSFPWIDFDTQWGQ